MNHRPTEVQLIGTILAIRWSDGAESFLESELLRAASPSAEVAGERDILGQVHGRHAGTGASGVRVTGWDWIGGYALRLEFSDGHRTGLYSYDYLRRLGEGQ